jgi:dolichol kinase
MTSNIKQVEVGFSPISLAKELARKSIHISACAVALFLIGKDLPALELAFLPIMGLGFYITEKVDILGKTISFGNRRKWGGMLLALGLTLVMLAPVDYEVKKFAILTLMIADVAAAIVGKLVPIRKVEVLGAPCRIGC